MIKKQRSKTLKVYKNLNLKPNVCMLGFCVLCAITNILKIKVLKAKHKSDSLRDHSYTNSCNEGEGGLHKRVTKGGGAGQKMSKFA